MKRIMIIATLWVAFNPFNNKLEAQFTPVYTYCTLLDEVTFGGTYNNAGNYLLPIARGIYPQNPNSYSGFYYNHILYLTDLDFAPIDSIHLKTIGQHRLMPLQILKATSDTVIISGVALDTTTFLIDAFIVWLDNDLNVVNERIYGNPILDEQFRAISLNNKGNIVLNLGYQQEEGDLAKSWTGAYYEIDMLGNVIILKTDTSSPYMNSTHIFDLAEIERYAMYQGHRMCLFDYKFNLDTVVDYNIGLPCALINSLLSSNKDLVYYGECTMANPIPPAWEEIGIYKANITEGITDSLIIGVSDTNNRIPAICESANNSFFITCSKNLNWPPTDTWVSLYKADFDQGVHWSEHYGGYGEYYPVKIINHEDNSLVIISIFWDFHKFPGELYQEDVVILKVNLDSITTEIYEKEIPDEIEVYPNPFQDRIKFDLPKDKNFTLLLYDVCGKNIYSINLQSHSTLDLALLQNGVYFYRLFDNSCLTKSGKIIKVDRQTK